MGYKMLPLKRTTYVEFEYKKRALERALKKSLSCDEFMVILLWDKKIILQKKRRTAEIDKGTFVTL